MKQEAGQSTAIDRAPYAPLGPRHEKTLLPGDDAWEAATSPDRPRRTLVDRAVSTPIMSLDVGRALSWPMAERERAARALETEQRAHRLIEASRVKDDFLATLAHELRSPLASILLWMRLLRRGQLDVENAGRAVDAIERGAQLLSQLVEDVLDVARIASGKLTVQLTCVDLNSIVAAALEAFHPAAEAKHLRVEAHLDRCEMTVQGDAVRLHQILNNLLANAIKFTPEGGRITVELARTGPAARITVSDTGRGIAAEFLPRIFERSQQADASSGQRHDGLGLGLGIVRYLVERHGGTIAAASPGLGEGATFSVTLPLA